MANSSTSKFVAATILSLAMGTALVGCSDTSEPSTEESHDHSHDDGGTQSTDHGHDHAADADDTSTQATPDVYPGLLGQIVMLPIAGNPSSELKIHHEQIPNFKDKNGIVQVNPNGVSGMPSMPMPFPLSDGVSTEGLAIGDKVKFTFQINWGGTTGPAWEVTKIEKIDASTEINFNNFIDDATDAAEDAMNDMMDHTDHDMNHEGP